jgi:glycosyltransferase involved in cell wall biosynthesis
MKQKHKVCYILPEYKEDASTHLSHIGNLLKEASKELDIFLIVMRGKRPRGYFGCTIARNIDASNFLTQSIMLRFWILRARMKGYKDFYVHYSFIGAFIASLLVRITGGRVFYWNCGEPWKFERSPAREHFERMTYRNITYLVTGAGTLALDYEEHYGIPIEKIKVMNNWIDIDRFLNVPDKTALRKELKLPEDKKIIFFAHRLSSRKGSHMILPVASEILSERKDVLFVIAGTGQDEEMLRERVRRNTVLRGGVVILGAVPNREIQKYLATADIFFMPSQEEGFPRALLESMAAGVPSVSSDVGAVAWLLPRSSQRFIVPQNDVIAFVQAIRKLLSESSEYLEEIKQDLRERAAEFDTPIIAKQFVELFEKDG